MTIWPHLADPTRGDELREFTSTLGYRSPAEFEEPNKIRNVA